MWILKFVCLCPRAHSEYGAGFKSEVIYSEEQLH